MGATLLVRVPFSNLYGCRMIKATWLRLRTPHRGWGAWHLVTLLSAFYTYLSKYPENTRCNPGLALRVLCEAFDIYEQIKKLIDQASHSPAPGRSLAKVVQGDYESANNSQLRLHVGNGKPSHICSLRRKLEKHTIGQMQRTRYAFDNG